MGVRRISGCIPDSTVQVRVGTHGSSNGPTHDPTPQDRLSSFSIHYTNIRDLNSNFSSVESHLATSCPNLFLLSETQLSSQSSPDPFQISHYNLYSRFRSKGGICAYCNINTPIARLMDLESPHFDVLWLKIYLPTTTIFLCFCSAIQTRLGPSSLLEERSGVPIVFVVLLCCRLPPKLGEVAKVYR